MARALLFMMGSRQMPDGSDTIVMYATTTIGGTKKDLVVVHYNDLKMGYPSEEAQFVTHLWRPLSRF